MLKIREILLLSILLTAACGDAGSEAGEAQRAQDAAPQSPVVAPTPARVPEVIPSAEAATEDSQDAAEVVRTYFDHLEAGRYGEAWKMRSSRGASSPAQGREEFAAHYDRYASYRATIGTPSEPQGAAGSVYVEVPVQTFGRLKNGESFSSAGTITLRRSNNVPGSTPEQRRWHIYTGS